MPPRLLVVQPDPDKPLGRIADELAKLGVELDVRSPSAPLPAAAGYDGLAVLPGLADPIDDDPAVQRARDAIDGALGAGVPVLGLCLGGQLLVQALGGDVYGCTPELGYGPIDATPDTADDPLLAGASGTLAVFHAHAFGFRPPPGAVVLLENAVCIQACRIGENWAFQCHPEVTRDWAEALAGAIRGAETAVAARTARFFRSNGIDPDRLERDAAAADAEAGRLAAGIACGFAARCARVTAGR
jgi:GMP synthase (glutamine-hydrolysing)